LHPQRAGATDPAAAAIRLWKAMALALLCAARRAPTIPGTRTTRSARARRSWAGPSSPQRRSSGIYYNPAGICDTRRLNVSVSASLYGIERQSQGAIRLGAGTFSIATLNDLNVIPGEVGLIKGVGRMDERGAAIAYGFDVTVPSFRAYGPTRRSRSRRKPG